MEILKLVKTASVREHIDAHYRNEISYSKAVDLINEEANKQLELHIAKQKEKLNCEHNWIIEAYDCYGLPYEKYCDKCGENEWI